MKPVLLKELREQFRSELRKVYPPQEIDSIFHLLTAHFFGFPRTLLAMEPAKELHPEEALRLHKALEDLRNHLPVQYITGRAFFLGMELQVSPSVLIPRPETAELVHWILESESPGHIPFRVLDVGTGSGCIALGIKKLLPTSEVHALDVSAEALDMARRNAKEHRLEMSFHQADICAPGGNWPEFDLLVSNPPYVPEKEWETMDRHVAEGEPHLALFVPDEDPLKIYGCICGFAVDCLVPGGHVYVEIHKDFGPQVVALFKAHGFSQVVLKKDIFGRDRFVRGKWTGPHPGGGDQ